MASTSESGHAKNVANFDSLVTFVAGYGTAYNPSKPSILLDALQALSVLAKSALSAVNTNLAAHRNAIAAREVAFKPLSKLITRVMNAIRATNTSQQVDDSARTLARKIQGIRSTPKLTNQEKQARAAEGKTVKEISASQMSYDSRMENFDKLIQLLRSIPEYTPNEEELQVDSLTSLLNVLKTKNAAVNTANTAWSNVRIVRNDILYNPDTGLVDTALAVKSYAKSLFGATSPHYKQISGLEFKNIKI